MMPGPPFPELTLERSPTCNRLHCLSSSTCTAYHCEPRGLNGHEVGTRWAPPRSRRSLYCSTTLTQARDVHWHRNWCLDFADWSGCRVVDRHHEPRCWDRQDSGQDSELCSPWTEDGDRHAELELRKDLLDETSRVGAVGLCLGCWLCRRDSAQARLR